jgi:hypothetical protein
MPKNTPSAPRRAPAASEPETLVFGLENWLLLAAGALAIVIGYVLLAGGSTVAAPLLLVLGYLVLIPLGIIR